jgi:hypothetical protein
MLHGVRTGADVFRHVHGVGFFEHLAGHPEDATIFNACMSSGSGVRSAAILSTYDFSAFRMIVDVGGGRGALLTQILARNPACRGMLYDSATVLDEARFEAPVAARCEKVPGSFFERVPEGGDLYILQQVLHDWSDNDAVAILRRCRSAMSEGSKLLVIELAAPAEGDSCTEWATADLLMMLLLNGRERNEQELRQILEAAGFALSQVVRTRSPFWIVEATPA